MSTLSLHKRRKRIISRVRAQVIGSPTRPRVAVYRSHIHISAQAIDDSKGITLAAAYDDSVKNAKNKTERAFAVGQELAKKLREKGLTAVVFDRRYYRYSGRVKALAEGLRSVEISL
ncbi:MAG: 50S ribosomal protein L18 [Microgenomates bacterium OLB22]|nr:MAG: 50S ribosomal protein L18 [Microgenomates bacterium OLB22]